MQDWTKVNLHLRTSPLFIFTFMFIYAFHIYTHIYVYVFAALCYLYEGWNFNSGNYLFTTDTK